MERQKIIDILNNNRANEIIAIMQYMNHHYRVTGRDFATLADMFKDHALNEMQHAERLAERINMLGGKPISRNEAIMANTDLRVIEGDNMDNMTQADLRYERMAIDDYADSIKQIGDDDPVTRSMLEEILAQEEQHAYELATYLGEEQMPFGLKAVGE